MLVVGVFVFLAGVCVFAEGMEGKVNINTGTESQLALLPGVGTQVGCGNHKVQDGQWQFQDLGRYQKSERDCR